MTVNLPGLLPAAGSILTVTSPVLLPAAGSILTVTSPVLLPAPGSVLTVTSPVLLPAPGSVLTVTSPVLLPAPGSGSGVVESSRGLLPVLVLIVMAGSSISSLMGAIGKDTDDTRLFLALSLLSSSSLTKDDVGRCRRSLSAVKAVFTYD